MNEPNDQHDKLEPLLRQWGAREAAEHQQLPPVPRPVLAIRPLAWIWRYALPAAAILIVGIFLGVGLSGGWDDGQADATPGQVDDLRHKIEQLEIVQKALEFERDGLQDRFALEVNDLTEKLSREAKRAGQATASLAKVTGELATATGEMARLEGQLSRLTESDAEAGKLRVSLAMAQKELARLRTMHDAALAAQGKAEAAMAVSRMQRVQWIRQMRGMYLATSAPGKVGIEALQTAARGNRLLERYEIFRSVVVGSGHPVFDGVEILLTRLELLDPQDTVATKAWRDAVRASRIVEKVEGVALSPAISEKKRIWLMEVRLIFAEDSHVG